MLCLGISANAHQAQCKVPGTDGGVSVSVNYYDSENGKITIDYGNETSVPVNITVTINYSINGGTNPIKHTIYAGAYSGGSKEFSGQPKKASVSSISVSGQKCN